MQDNTITLYSYWRSSAAYRVRIGLNLKHLPYEIAPVHLLREGGEQHSEAYRTVNPQQLVPALQHGQRVYRQSLAILEYLDEQWPDPALMPATARDRQRVRALAQLIACDIHPLNNLRVMQYFEREWSVPQSERDDWSRHWMRVGFDAFEDMITGHPSTGEFCDGGQPGLAECCMVPQMYNARRFGLDLAPYSTMLRIEAACLELPAFKRAHPDVQPDAPHAG